jgi:hypothetical protein
MKEKRATVVEMDKEGYSRIQISKVTKLSLIQVSEIIDAFRRNEME